MDLQPSGRGKEELLCLETDKIYFTIKGKNRNSEIDEQDTESKGFSISYAEEGINLIIDAEKAYFFEYENYELIIEKKDRNTDIGFYHVNKDIRNKITKNRSGSLSGIVSFKGEIGFSDLVLRVNGKDHLIIKVEVFPTKIDYRKDYMAILKDVNEEIYNLVFDFLKRTYSISGLSKNKGTSLTEYYSILTYIFEKLKKALNIITAMPHHSLVNERQIAPYHKIKNVTSETIKWLEKRPEKLIKKGDKLVPVEALQINKRVTLDTNENRFLKFIIKGILFKLKELRKRYLALGRGIDNSFVLQLEGFIKDMNKYLTSTFLKDVGEYEFRENSSLVFKMALGYKDVYKYYLMLQKGLTLKGELFKLNIKDLPLLYEYWCFIKINGILRKNYILISNDTVKVKNNGIFVSLKKGMESKVVYENPKNGERFELFYNSKMKSETVGQKPDNVLAINKIGGKVTYNYIFDAKYKLDRAVKGTTYEAANKTPGPKEEDINTMHKYRDAIVYENKKEGRLENSIFGAFVLFPYNNEEEYSKHPLYKSIETVNIGGIPFLPTATKLMEEFLKELIGESYLSSFERVLDQKGKEYYMQDSYFKDRNVLVGSLSNKEQLESIKKYKFYHTKLKNVSLNKHVIKTVAISQSKTNFKEAAGILYYGEVIDYQILKRKDITEIPKVTDKPEELEELYIKFILADLKTLDKKTEVYNYNVRKIMYTSQYLLKNSRIVSELCIRSKEEFRLWWELKNLYKDVVCVAEDESNAIKGFSVDGMDVYMVGDKIKVLDKGNVVMNFDLDKFVKSPRKIVKEIGVIKD